MASLRHVPFAREYRLTPFPYATVHAYGVPTILNEREEVLGVLSETISTYESSRGRPWSGELPADYRDRMIQGIVAFEIPISRIEGKFKLGQNRSAADLQGVFDALNRSADPDSQAVAQFMAAELESITPR